MTQIDAATVKISRITCIIWVTFGVFLPISRWRRCTKLIRWLISCARVNSKCLLYRFECQRHWKSTGSPGNAMRQVKVTHFVKCIHYVILVKDLNCHKGMSEANSTSCITLSQLWESCILEVLQCIFSSIPNQIFNFISLWHVIIILKAVWIWSTLEKRSIFYKFPHGFVAYCLILFYFLWLHQFRMDSYEPQVSF